MNYTFRLGLNQRINSSTNRFSFHGNILNKEYGIRHIKNL